VLKMGVWPPGVGLQKLASRAQSLGRTGGRWVTGRFSPGGPGQETENLEN